MKTGIQKVSVLLILVLACGLLLVGAISLLVGRREGQNMPHAEWKMDVPEATIQSYYAMKKPLMKDAADWMQKNHYAFFTRRYVDQAKKEAMEYARFDSDMRIESVRIETPRRAIVMCTYVSRVEQESERSTLKCVLTKEGNKWRIDGLFEPCYQCDRTGQVRDYAEEPGEPPSMKLCDVCKGTGWHEASIFVMW